MNSFTLASVGRVSTTALCVALTAAGCSGQAPASQVTNSPANPTAAVTTSRPSAEPSASVAAEVSPVSCVPGTWNADMVEFVSTFQTPGKPKYRGGSYTFIFDQDFDFSAVGDDVTFRLSQDAGFVDVHNSWQESGLWGMANDNTSFDEVLTVLGIAIESTAEEIALIVAQDESRLIALAGQAYEPGESYGMVNGSVRTPPLSDEGTAISAVGWVDCDAKRIELLVSGTGWKGGFALTRD